MTDWSVVLVIEHMTTTRDNLLEKATQLFLEKGYSAVGTNELCSAASVNKGTFYHFFPSKADLLVQVIEEYSAEISEQFERIANSDISPEAKLVALFDVPKVANDAWKVKHGYAQGCLVGNMTLELGGADEKIRAAIRASIAQWCRPIASVVAELIGTKVLPEVDKRQAAEVVVALIQGGLLLAKTMNDPNKITLMASGAIAHLKANT
ncbi:TetR/AcrR family transcriptional regulator [Ruegeria sp. MALMAid1280]|uniref:TetR/AcrR family transcriptional regulator n=1 Tax=Ruegeria sp. MALMAid1280 TaxID=3411634 RepID=UPI003B9E248D